MGHGISEIELLRYYREYVEIKIANGEMPLTFERWAI
jgi:hypothetical protein